MYNLGLIYIYFIFCLLSCVVNIEYENIKKAKSIKSIIKIYIEFNESDEK